MSIPSNLNCLAIVTSILNFIDISEKKISIEKIKYINSEIKFVIIFIIKII